MQCPNCKMKYKPGETVCPGCGTSLTPDVNVLWGWTPVGKLTEQWPRCEDGQFVLPALLTHCTSLDLQDEMLVNMLSAYGIPAFRLYPNDGSFGRVVLGMSGGGADIYVPQTLLDDARSLISEDCEIEEGECNEL